MKLSNFSLLLPTRRAKTKARQKMLNRQIPMQKAYYNLYILTFCILLFTSVRKVRVVEPRDPYAKSKEEEEREICFDDSYCG